MKKNKKTILIVIAILLLTSLALELISSSKDILKNNFNGNTSLLDYLMNLIR